MGQEGIELQQKNENKKPRLKFHKEAHESVTHIILTFTGQYF